jgi:formate hydrogenlyase subunit 3/multisubunit Na+/H+ antiporter MnhD subunit
VKDSNTCLKFFKPNLNQQTGIFVSAFFFLVVTLIGLFAVSNILNLYIILEVYSLAFYLLILSIGYKFLTSGLSSALFQYLIINSILSGAF